MSSEFKVLEFEKLPVVDHGNGVMSRLLIGRHNSVENLTTGITNFPPGTKIAFHYHNCDESVLILAGTAVAEIAGQRFPLNQYDTTYVPAGVAHRFINDSDRLMTMMWIYPTGYVTRTFVETGVTVEHSSREDQAATTAGD